MSCDVSTKAILPVSRGSSDRLAGGIWSIMQHEISRGRAKNVPQLVPQLLDIVLVPFGLRAGDAAEGTEKHETSPPRQSS